MHFSGHRLNQEQNCCHPSKISNTKDNMLDEENTTSITRDQSENISSLPNDRLRNRINTLMGEASSENINTPETIPFVCFELEVLLDWMMQAFINPPNVGKWKEYFLFPGVDPETVKHAYYKFLHKKGDVLVATYSKTGTTWLTEIVRNILYIKDKELLAKAKRIQQLYSYLEAGPVSKYQVVENFQLPRRFFGTHLPAPLVNLEKFRENDTKILYAIRNPKDQAVSFYHFQMSLPFVKKEPWCRLRPQNEREFYNLYLTGQQNVTAKKGEGYLEHVRGWYDHRNDSNVMFLVYEEMKQDIHREIRKIAKFIDVDLSDDDVDQVVQNTSFKMMKEAAVNSDKSITGKMNMFRKGQVGDWKNHLTVAQSELIDANVERVLGDTDIKFIYKLDEN